MEYYIRKDVNKKLKQYQLNRKETTIRSVEEKQKIGNMSRIIRVIDKRAPWNPMCLNLAMVAKFLLRQQGIETTIRIGFKPRELNKKYEGHAWLTINDILITGWLKDLDEYVELK